MYNTCVQSKYNLNCISDMPIILLVLLTLALSKKSGGLFVLDSG